MTGFLRDKVPGYELELIPRSQDKHWALILEHEIVAFQFFLGGGNGGTGFTASVQGDRMGRELAMTEALTFPRMSPLFKPQYSED